MADGELSPDAARQPRHRERARRLRVTARANQRQSRGMTLEEACNAPLPPHVETAFDKWAKGQTILQPHYPETMHYGPGEEHWDFRRGGDPAWRGGYFI